MDFSHTFEALPADDGKRSSASAGSAAQDLDPRVVTTGRKIATSETPDFTGVDQDTGEPVHVFASRGYVHAVRQLQPCSSANENAAIIDALAFSLVPPDEKSHVWLLEQMAQFMVIEDFKPKRGCFGFRYSAHFDGGLIAWGGESQRGRVYFSLMGKGCGMVSDWHAMAEWLENHRAAIKRCDLAHDDFDGQRVSIDWAVSQYKGDGFNAGGRKPRHQVFGDWLDGADSAQGRTLAIGNRASGKYGRIYEKGKQLGEPSSAWTRIEVEWRAQDRHIPYDILTRPGHYLAGAYPCLSFLEQEQSVIKTVSKAARIAFDRAVENAKQQCGKLVNLMLSVAGGDYVEVVQRLTRPGFPSRIEPFSYHVGRDPTMLDRALQGAA